MRIPLEKNISILDPSAMYHVPLLKFSYMGTYLVLTYTCIEQHMPRDILIKYISGASLGLIQDGCGIRE